MKRLIFILLLVIPICKAADYSSSLFRPLSLSKMPIQYLAEGETILTIELPSNPANLAVVTLNLEDKEPLTEVWTFKNLINRSHPTPYRLAIAFSQDAHGNWHATAFDAGYYEYREIPGHVRPRSFTPDQGKIKHVELVLIKKGVKPGYNCIIL